MKDRKQEAIEYLSTIIGEWTTAGPHNQPKRVNLEAIYDCLAPLMREGPDHITEKERRGGGKRRNGLELTGIVNERYPNGARDERNVWRVQGTLAWASDRRILKDRRK